MTEMKTYKCDRCGVTFTKKIDEKPSEVTLEDRDVLNDPRKAWDLCVDCVNVFYDWLNHDKDFDKFAESKQKKLGKGECSSMTKTVTFTDQIAGLPEKDHVRFSLIYIAQMLENIHKDLLDLNQHLEEGVTTFTGKL